MFFILPPPPPPFLKSMEWKSSASLSPGEGEGKPVETLGDALAFGCGCLEDLPLAVLDTG